ncbi:MAG: hypothetical protein QM504_00900 [Pseudomonadota bacterium]
MPQAIFIFILFFFLNANSHAKEYIWLIGGGPKLENSQAQIELNTRWVQQIISKYKPDAKTKVFFTDGNDPDSDVRLQINNKDSAENLAPLARIFNAQLDNKIRYYNHRVTNVYGTTDVNFLQAELTTDFKKLKADDEVLMIFQGHGGLNKYDTLQNSLKLWNNTHLSVIQLEEMLQKLNTGVSVRYIFPQCFSGAFKNLIYPRANNKLSPAAYTRCGFMAEDAYEQSEGCTTSINENDYRDYSSYFFAALDGKTRTGKSLSRNPDRNNDNKISLTEAHFYSLSQAISTDIPRSTSESYLINWSPWYLHWIKNHKVANNIYSKLAEEVAQNNQLKLNLDGQITDVKNLFKTLYKQKKHLAQQKSELKQKISSLQEQLSQQVSKKWPYLLSPNTKKYLQLLNTQLTDIQRFIIKQNNYTKLVKAQNQENIVTKQSLQLKRKITQVQKINHLNRLANTLEYFNQHADILEKQSYLKLVKCESKPF